MGCRPEGQGPPPEEGVGASRSWIRRCPPSTAAASPRWSAAASPASPGRRFCRPARRSSSGPQRYATTRAAPQGARRRGVVVGGLRGRGPTPGPGSRAGQCATRAGYRRRVLPVARPDRMGSLRLPGQGEPGGVEGPAIPRFWRACRASFNAGCSVAECGLDQSPLSRPR